jgi:hypothetical protein
MRLRRLGYWSCLLALAAVWETGPADDWAACEAAAAAAGEAEWAPNGLTLFPPGYECSYIGRDEAVPLDAGGWLELVAAVGIPVLIVYGLAAFLARQLRRRARRTASA